MAAVSLTFTFPDAATTTRIATALCANAGLPVSAINAKQALVNYITQTVRQYEVVQAIQAVKPGTDPTIT